MSRIPFAAAVFLVTVGLVLGVSAVGRGNPAGEGLAAACLSAGLAMVGFGAWAWYTRGRAVPPG
jgi:hypothetical protein